LFVNAHSEAIFGSKPWIYLNEGSVWYTSQLRDTTGFDPYRLFNPQQQNNTIIYAFVTTWPNDNLVTLSHVKPTAQTTVKLFSTNGQFIQLNYTALNGGIQTSVARISAPRFAPSSVNAGIFALKIEYAADDSFVPIAVQSTCQDCQVILEKAGTYFQGGISQADLLTKLLADCGTFPTSNDQSTCKDIVNKNIDFIYSDFQKGKNSGQVCDDLKICVAA
jgi:hypothetical protein